MINIMKTFESLEKKNEILVSSMSKNFGKTQQDLPNFKMPEAIQVKGAVGRVSLMGKQTDLLGLDSLFGAATDKRDLEVDIGAGNLKMPLSKATRQYLPKKSHKIVYPKNKHQNDNAEDDHPQISEEDIGKGMY